MTAMSDYDDAMRRALGYSDDVGLSDGTDRPATSVDELDEQAAPIPAAPAA